MPTVLRIGPFAFMFFGSDIGEPPHVHVKQERSQAKFWLEPVELEWSRGFAEHELNVIRKLVIEHKAFLLGKWNEFFN